MASKHYRFAINGAGRIGRCVFRAFYQYRSHFPNIELVAINDPHDANQLRHLLTYDSVHGRFDKSLTVNSDQSKLSVDGTEIALRASREPNSLDWGSLGVDVVVECTGRLKTRQACESHLQAGASKVLISAPSPDADATIVLGANESCYHPSQSVLSIGSCTTNALAPILQQIQQKNPIEHGFITTIHAYTNDQSLVDRHHSDLRRARAANLSIIPTKTGAAKAIGQVMPELSGRLQGYALRVPTANVSALELNLKLASSATTEEILTWFKPTLGPSGLPVLALTNEPLVSIDFNQHPASSVIDTTYLACESDHLKLLAWYDNEWAYALRLLDMMVLMQLRSNHPVQKTTLELACEN